jgi:hypothetical protein
MRQALESETSIMGSAISLSRCREMQIEYTTFRSHIFISQILSSLSHVSSLVSYLVSRNSFRSNLHCLTVSPFSISSLKEVNYG